MVKGEAVEKPPVGSHAGREGSRVENYVPIPGNLAQAKPGSLPGPFSGPGRRPIVAVDLDGVLARYDGWRGIDHIGDPLPGAVEFTRRLAAFAEVLVWTTRCSPEANPPYDAEELVGVVMDWLNRHGFCWHRVWAGRGKPIAAAYVDDRAVACRPQASADGDAYASTMDDVLWLCGRPTDAAAG